MSVWTDLLEEQRQAALDDLLSRWHHWCMSERVAQGYEGEAAGFDAYQTSRQYDDQNGALDDAIENDIMTALNAIVDNMAATAQLVLRDQARALCLGVDVFRNPRLPASREVRGELLRQAREELIERLVAGGIME